MRDLSYIRGRVVDEGPVEKAFAKFPGQRYYVWHFVNSRTGERIYCDNTGTSLSRAMDSCTESVSELRAYMVGREFARMKGSMLSDILAVIA